jgi:tRNA modification GTPase
MRDEDTIAALSTPVGKGGIAIIRISGSKSKRIAKKIYKGQIIEKRVNYGTLYLNKKPIDNIILLYHKKPKSYTGEDIIEIHTHGSMVLVEEVLNFLYKNGIRVAEPGEFTKRAFLNGKIDLLQAEAINNIIDSITIRGAEIAFSNLKGTLSKKVEAMRKGIIEILSFIEASIDFPDYEIELDKKKVVKILEETEKKITALVKSYNYGKILKEGYDIVLTGKPNVGKSSLLNAILQEKRAIVSEKPGTTRDFIKEKITYKGVGFNIIDIAGIDEEEKGKIEKEGVKIAKEIISKSENILFMIDSSEKITKKDKEIYFLIKEKKVILVINKTDKEKKIDEKGIKRIFPKIKQKIEISAKYEKNIEKLLDKMKNYFIEEEGKKTKEILLSFRQKQLFEKTGEIIKETIPMIKKGTGEEIIAEKIREIKLFMEELTGEISNEMILDKIFKDFCIGK